LCQRNDYTKYIELCIAESKYENTFHNTHSTELMSKIKIKIDNVKH
ncbi:unnamed protein product, partial [Allacma fusca]